MRCPKHKYQTFIVALARGSLHAISFYVLESRLNFQRRRILSESSNPCMFFFSIFCSNTYPFWLLFPSPPLSEERSKWIVDDQHLTQILHSLRSPVTPPAQRVQFILGQESQDLEHESHPVFSEMEELYVGEDGNMEWKETARWQKMNLCQDISTDNFSF